MCPNSVTTHQAEQTIHIFPTCQVRIPRFKVQLLLPFPLHLLPAPCGKLDAVDCTQIECQNRCLKRCQIRWECHKDWQNICQKVCQNRCQIECRSECQIECQCVSICQKECQNLVCVYIYMSYILPRNYVRIVWKGGVHSKVICVSTVWDAKRV